MWHIRRIPRHPDTQQSGKIIECGTSDIYEETQTPRHPAAMQEHGKRHMRCIPRDTGTWPDRGYGMQRLGMLRVPIERDP